MVEADLAVDGLAAEVQGGPGRAVDAVVGYAAMRAPDEHAFTEPVEQVVAEVFHARGVDVIALDGVVRGRAINVDPGGAGVLDRVAHDLIVVTGAALSLQPDAAIEGVFNCIVLDQQVVRAADQNPVSPRHSASSTRAQC